MEVTNSPPLRLLLGSRTAPIIDTFAVFRVVGIQGASAWWELRRQALSLRGIRRVELLGTRQFVRVGYEPNQVSLETLLSLFSGLVGSDGAQLVLTSRPAGGALRQQLRQRC